MLGTERQLLPQPVPLAPAWERGMGHRAEAVWPRVPQTVLIRSPLPSIPRRSRSRAKGQGTRILPNVVPRMGLDDWGANEPRQMRRCLYHLCAEGCCCTRWAFSLPTQTTGGSPGCPNRSPHHCQMGLALGPEGLRRLLMPLNSCHIGP